MCAIGYFLEREGIMTTGISLVRENAASLQPPRSLWVSFPLGRPLGAPNDPTLQHRVVAAALGLLERPAGPVLEDYPEDAPAVDVETAPACPVSFAKDQDFADTWTARLARELALLKPWHDLGRRRRQGRTIVGVADHSIEQILEQLGELLDAGELPSGNLRPFKLGIEDAKAFYIEALTAQPGAQPMEAIQNTLWHDTQLGAGLAVFYERFRANPKLRLFARMVAPREAIGASTGEEVEFIPNSTRAV